MKRIIALAAVGLFVSACDFDLREDEKSASTIRYAMVTGRAADSDAGNGGTMNGPWLGEGAASNDLVGTPSHGTFGRMLVVTTDGLLDGASIEATPQTCLQAGNWLAVTGTNLAALPAGGIWYTCYYPSSATTDDGASVYIFYATIAPGTTTASQPVRSGTLVAGDYNFTGSILAKNGSAFPIDIDLSVGEVLISSEDADDEIAVNATNLFTGDLQNRTPAETTWALAVVNADTGDPITGDAGAGTLSGEAEVDADTDSITYTAPATVPAVDPANPDSTGGILVTVTATADRLTNTYGPVFVAP